MAARMKKLGGGGFLRAVIAGFRPHCVQQEFHFVSPISEEFTAAKVAAAAPVQWGVFHRSFRTGFGHSSSGGAVEQAGLPATTRDQKPRLVVLGSGWGACRLLKDINMRLYDVVCVSPRNHMVFTPLLASTCVGTLEFRSVAESVRSIQPALSMSPDSNYFLARCTAINTQKHEVYNLSIYVNPKPYLCCQDILSSISP
jgi:hypothetical protein